MFRASTHQSQQRTVTCFWLTITLWFTRSATSVVMDMGEGSCFLAITIYCAPSVDPFLSAPPVWRILSETVSPTPEAHASARDQEPFSGLVPAPLPELDLRFGGSSFQRQGGTGNRSWDGAGNSWGQSDQSRLPIPQPLRLPSPQNLFIRNGRCLAAASSNARSTMIVPLSRIPFALYGSGGDLRNNSLALPSRLDMSRQVSTLVFMPLTTWRWYSGSVANPMCV